ncbi:MAG TPA: hypothetical protein DDZ51_01445 [Planctomycetaceae bacterium]|nr:hypothetical protein [Planctomycetaceae bacterium]
MSNEARHRDIAALLARGVIRVKKQPLVAKAIESHMLSAYTNSPDQISQDESMNSNDLSTGQVDSMAPSKNGGDQ